MLNSDQKTTGGINDVKHSFKTVKKLMNSNDRYGYNTAILENNVCWLFIT